MVDFIFVILQPLTACKLSFFDFFMSAQLSLTDEQFPVDEELGRGSLTTSVSDLATEARQIAQVTMGTYV